uniref:Nucleotide-binding alpha-beta plait domain-containing protein n=1 Tax=Tanacetum cinerariifolium TaxID=118510 RepID=A0A699SAX0_TANCI|nr:hypothetical protein [Tanacetum cinerariifolium]
MGSGIYGGVGRWEHIRRGDARHGGGMPKNNIFGESSDPNAIAETVFTESVGLNGMQSADPFNIYDLLNKGKQQENTKVSDDSISREHPPGFTPKEDDKELDHVDDNISEPKED